MIISVKMNNKEGWDMDSDIGNKFIEITHHKYRGDIVVFYIQFSPTSIIRHYPKIARDSFNKYKNVIEINPKFIRYDY